jgi:hypothetical protein
MSTTPDINFASFSASGSCWNPDALQNPPPRLVPPDLNMAPANASAFASILKIGDGRNTETFTYPATNPIAQGKEGVVDICNAVTGVTVNAVYGTGGVNGERVGSFKGTTGVKVQGTRNCNGTWCTWVIGRWYDEGKQVDRNLDLSAVPGGGTVVIARGLWTYLFGNGNNINIGTCKIAFFKSVAEWVLVVIKGIFN